MAWCRFKHACLYLFTILATAGPPCKLSMGNGFVLYFLSYHRPLELIALPLIPFRIMYSSFFGIDRPLLLRVSSSHAL